MVRQQMAADSRPAGGDAAPAGKGARDSGDGHARRTTDMPSDCH